MRLSPQLRYKIIKFLKANTDCFAWSHLEMTGIPLEVAVHKLRLDPNFPPVNQKKWPITEDRNKHVKEEVTRLLNICSIREVEYSDWLDNVVLVPKKIKKIRTCIDFKGFNKVFPKDSFPLLNNDQIISATTRHELISFLDAYSVYNQIRIHLEDQEETSYITNCCTYCYNMLPLG